MTNRGLKLRTLILLVFMAISIGTFFHFSSVQAASSGPYDYTPLENIPGFEGKGNDLKGFIESIYQFGIWTVGIAAVLMITIGGFMYLTSAGNTSSAQTAKKVITDAIIGLVVALSAYLILYVINPDLIKVNISMKQLGTSSGTNTGGTGAGAGTTSPTTSSGTTCNDGKCSQVDSAISNNASGIDNALLKSLFVGGEGCNSANSPKGACGYSQVMPLIRNAYCNGVTCDQLRADVQLDINCGAAYVKNEIMAQCNGDAKCSGACYNQGITICKKNPSACGEANYCQRVQNYYNSCSK